MPDRLLEADLPQPSIKRGYGPVRKLGTAGQKLATWDFLGKLEGMDR